MHTHGYHTFRNHIHVPGRKKQEENRQNKHISWRSVQWSWGWVPRTWTKAPAVYTLKQRTGAEAESLPLTVSAVKWAESLLASWSHKEVGAKGNWWGGPQQAASACPTSESVGSEGTKAADSLEKIMKRKRQTNFLQAPLTFLDSNSFLETTIYLVICGINRSDEHQLQNTLWENPAWQRRKLTSEWSHSLTYVKQP